MNNFSVNWEIKNICNGMLSKQAFDINEKSLPYSKSELDDFLITGFKLISITSLILMFVIRMSLKHGLHNFMIIQEN